MPEANLVATYKAPTGADVDDWLRLEQVEPPLPAGNFLEWLYSQGIVAPSPMVAFQMVDNYMSACNGEGGYVCEIKITLSRPDISYQLHVDRPDAELSDLVLHEDKYRKIWKVSSPSESYTPDIAVTHLTGEGAEWLFCATKDGRPVEGPSIMVSENGSLYWAGEYQGTIRVDFISENWRRELTVPPDPALAEGGEDAYQCNVIASWGDGNLEYLTINPPEIKGECKGGISFSVTDPDDEDGEEDEDDGEQDRYRRTVKLWACSMEVLSDTLTKI